MRSKFLAVAMVATLLTTTVMPNSNVLAGITQDSVKGIQTESKRDYKKQRLTDIGSNGSVYKAEDEVTIIVELKDLSLLKKFNEEVGIASSTYDTNEISSYLTSDQAESESSKMRRSQSTVIDKINRMDKTKGLRAAGVEVLYNYTAIMNGFAIKAKYNMLDKIKALPEVKRAYIGTSYSLEEPEMTSSNEMIQSTATWDLNYQGEGMVVAILDTGLDTNHEAFQDDEMLRPRITLNEIEEAKKSNSPVADGSYVSAKVPYAYDYADEDSNVVPTEVSVEVNGNDHGTHVAGTVAGNSDTIKGVAPQAQLLIMKVFSDEEGNTGAATENILAGLEDAVKLGTDVINMSLGSASGYSVGQDEAIREVYESIVEAGINLSVSAGNNHSFSYNNEAGGAFTENPDTSVVGSPSTYAASTSVASVINSGYYASYFTAGGNKITYTETAAGSQPRLSDLVETGEEQAYEYVLIPGVGNSEDYNGIDVSGKIAVVSRGAISFNNKALNAKAASASAIVVCNNTTGTINMQIDNYVIPAVAITQADGEILRNSDDKTIMISNKTGHFDSDAAYKMSDFSSWGVTPDLKLKPEITAPGENIYSTLPFHNSYGSMSGTSMAAPHIAGAFALVKQYIKENNVPSVTDISGKVSDLANQLLMSTAIPVKNEEGDYYSPRKQGSGLVNVYRAVTTGAYAYVKDETINNRPKLDLMDSEAGVFEAEFHVRSVTGSALSYQIDYSALTEAAQDYYILEKPLDITPFVTVSTEVNGVATNYVTLEGYGDATVHVTITLGEEVKNYINKTFDNGEFIDGYVFLNSEEVPDLTLPFMGFYGDWTKAGIMDSSTIYDNNFYSSGDQEVYQQTSSFIYGDDGTTLLGVNPYDNNAYALIGGGYNVYENPEYFKEFMLPLDMNKIAISPNGDGYYDEVDTAKISLLRNAKTLTSRIENSKGELEIKKTLDYETKSSYYKDKISPTYDTLDWIPKSFENNETYIYSITGTLDYEGEQNNVKSSMTFPITIDVEKPVLNSLTIGKENGTVTATLEVKDNQYTAFAGLYEYDTEQGAAIDGVLLNESSKGVTSKVTFDITDYINTGAEYFAVVVGDYAGNDKVYICTTSGKIITDHNDNPTPVPTQSPTPVPTQNPTPVPTQNPTPVPTQNPTPSPKPTQEPGPNSGDSSSPTSGDTSSTGNAKNVTTVQIKAEPKDKEIMLSADTLKDILANKELETISILVTVNDTVQSVKVSSDAMKAVQKAGKNINITLKDNKGNLVGSWQFKGEDLKDLIELSDLELFTTVATLQSISETGSTIAKALKDSGAKGIYLNAAQEGVFITQGEFTVSLSKVEGAEPGKKIYLYKINKETGKLESIAKSFAYKADSKGNVTIPFIEGGEYVILTKKVPYKYVTTLKNQIKVSLQENTIQLGAKESISVTLPKTLQVVGNLDAKTKFSAIDAATITYKTSNRGVVIVSKGGKITAKKAGSATITVTVKLKNGTSKTFRLKINVK